MRYEGSVFGEVFQDGFDVSFLSVSIEDVDSLAVCSVLRCDRGIAQVAGRDDHRATTLRVEPIASGAMCRTERRLRRRSEGRWRHAAIL